MTKDCSTCFYKDSTSVLKPCQSCTWFDKYVNANVYTDEFGVPKITANPPIGPFVKQSFTIKPEGKKYDSGKPDWSLLPFKAVSETVDVLTFGDNKYGPENWRLVHNAKKRYLAAAFRHIVAYATGEKKDSESGLSHLSHALCCLLFILELEKSDDTSNA